MKAFLKKYKVPVIILASILAVCMLVPLTINGIVMATTSGNIREITPEDGYEYAVVLGAKVHKGGRLSDMLRDRMDAAIALYQDGAVKKLLVSGDGRGEWSETEHMKRYAIENGVLEGDIVMDGEGFSTYETVTRAKNIYALDRFVLVTQKYHLYRAIYIAETMDIETLGADGALHSYAGQWHREIREILARMKDFLVCCFD